MSLDTGIAAVESRRQALHAWLALLSVLAVVSALVWWGQRAPQPKSLDVSAQEFSEARALRVVRKLADELGPHPIGSLAGAAAAEFLATSCASSLGSKWRCKMRKATIA
jgi:hypothetical protein